MLVSVVMLIVAYQAARRWNVWFSIERSASGKQKGVARSASISLRCAVIMPSLAWYVLLVPICSVRPSLDTNNPHFKESAKKSVPYTTSGSHISAWAVCAPLLKLIFCHILFHSFCPFAVLLVLPCHQWAFHCHRLPTHQSPHRFFFKVFCHFSFGCHSIYNTFPSNIGLILSVWAGAMEMEGKNWWELKQLLYVYYTWTSHKNKITI